MSVVIGILSLITLPNLWRGIRSVVLWLRPAGLKRQTPPTILIGETAYTGCNPFSPNTPIKGVIVQLNLGNPDGQKPQTIMTFRLDVEGKLPYPVSEARISGTGDWILIPASGGFSSVPNKPYFPMPVEIPPGGAKVGWIGFLFIQSDDMTLNQAWDIDAEVVGVQPDGKEIRVRLPACDVARVAGAEG